VLTHLSHHFSANANSGGVKQLCSKGTADLLTGSGQKKVSAHDIAVPVAVMVYLRSYQRIWYQSTAQHSTAQHSTAQHSTAQHGTALFSTSTHAKGKCSQCCSRICRVGATY
jgi:hypothetical protein